MRRFVAQALCLASLLSCTSAGHAEPLNADLTLWAGVAAPAGETRHDLDYAFGVDAEVPGQGGLRYGVSAGYQHAFTTDAGNVHRFPLLATVRADMAPARRRGPYAGVGLGLVRSDENSAALGVTRRTAPCWALLLGTQIGRSGRLEARYTASERPSRDGVFLVSVGLRP